MIERSDRVYLDPDVVRCNALAGCADQLQCARRMASVVNRAPLGDYSFNRVPGEVCKWFRPIERMAAPEPVQRPARPWPGSEE